MLINDKTEPAVIITLLSKNILHKQVVVLKYYKKTYYFFILGFKILDSFSYWCDNNKKERMK